MTRARADRIDRPQTVTLTLTWSSTAGTSATLNGQAVGLNGSTQFTPTQTTTCTLVVKGDGGGRRRRR